MISERSGSEEDCLVLKEACGETDRQQRVYEGGRKRDAEVDGVEQVAEDLLHGKRDVQDGNERCIELRLRPEHRGQHGG